MSDEARRRQVLLVAPRGLCAGVQRAIGTVERALAAHGAPVYVRRQIVHNDWVVADLERKGAVFVPEVGEAPPGAVLVLSAHGVAPTVYAEARARGALAIDATCPLVTKIHNETRRFAAAGYSVILIGQESHDEVIGTRGQAPEQVIVVSRPDDVCRVEVPDAERVAWVSQSTMVAEEVAEIVALLRQRFPRLADPPSDDICYAMSNRQAALKTIAGRSDLVLIVGGARSHNANALVPVALASGARAARRVGSAGELREEWLAGVCTVGVTSGASTPEIVVREVLTWLDERGYPLGEELVSKVETQTFAWPRNLESRSREVHLGTSRVGMLNPALGGRSNACRHAAIRHPHSAGRPAAARLPGHPLQRVRYRRTVRIAAGWLQAAELIRPGQDELSRPYGFLGAWQTVAQDLDLVAIESPLGDQPVPDGAALSDGGFVLSIKATSRFLGVAEGTVRKLVSDGEMKHVRFGKRIYITRDQINDFLHANTHAGYGGRW